MKMLFVVNFFCLVQSVTAYAVTSISCEIDRGAQGTFGRFVVHVPQSSYRIVRGSDRWVLGEIEMNSRRSVSAIQEVSVTLQNTTHSTYLAVIKRADDFAAAIAITTNSTTNRGTAELTHLLGEGQNVSRGTGTCSVQN